MIGFLRSKRFPLPPERLGIFDKLPPVGKGVRLAPFIATLSFAVLPACLFGGPSQEEFDLVTSQLSSTKLELQSADQLATSEKLKAANLRAEISTLKAQIAEAAQADEAGKISLERARLAVIKFAQQNLEVYEAQYQTVQLVWEVQSAEEQDEFYYITMTYQPFANFSGRSGLEEFILDKTGSIEFRQVLEPPDAQGEPRTKPAPKPAG